MERHGHGEQLGELRMPRFTNLDSQTAHTRMRVDKTAAAARQV